MKRSYFIHKRLRAKYSREKSLQMNRARWDADRRHREEELPERLRSLEEIQIQNLPQKQGDPVGSFQWTDFRTGKVRRWTVRIGDRTNRYTFEDSHGTTTKPHGFTWFLTRLRHYLINNA
jgi:hypothetical protein